MPALHPKTDERYLDVLKWGLVPYFTNDLTKARKVKSASVPRLPAVPGVAAVSGAKGRALYHPLRLALTGREHGPELKKLLPLIGREKALARLKGTPA